MERPNAFCRIGLALVVLAACIPSAAQATSCVLWNRLESASNVLNSEIGPGGSIVGSHYAFEPAQFGNGYVRKQVGEYLSFPGSILAGLTYRGTVEMWINSKVTAPEPYNYGIFSFVGAAYGHYGVPPSDIGLAWGDGVTGKGFMGGVSFGGVGVGTLTPVFIN